MGIEAYGSSRSEAIKETIKGLTVLIFGEVSASPVVSRCVNVCADDPVELLVATLNEILYQIEMDNLVPAGFDIDFLDKTELRGCLSGEVFDTERHQIERQAKSVTYHQACFEHDAAGWLARVYVDL